MTPPEITIAGDDAELSDAAISVLAEMLLAALDDETSGKEDEKKAKATSLN